MRGTAGTFRPHPWLPTLLSIVLSGSLGFSAVACGGEASRPPSPSPAGRTTSVGPSPETESIGYRDTEWTRFTDPENGLSMEVPATFVLESPSEAGAGGVMAARDPATGDLYTVTIGQAPGWWPERSWNGGAGDDRPRRVSRRVFDEAAARLTSQGWTDVAMKEGFGGYIWARHHDVWWLEVSLVGIDPSGKAGGVHSGVRVHQGRAYTVSAPVHFGPDSEFPGQPGPIYKHLISSVTFT